MHGMHVQKSQVGLSLKEISANYKERSNYKPSIVRVTIRLRDIIKYKFYCYLKCSEYHTKRPQVQ